MLNAGWLLGLALVASATLPACTTKTSLGRQGEDAGRDVRSATGCNSVPASVDLSCNDDPSLPTVAGICQSDGICACQPGFLLNSTSKRCRLDSTADAGVVICTVGADQTCNDDPRVSTITGTCMGGVACACKTGFLLNPATGRCRAASVVDAGAGIDSASGEVCTFLLDQTCNDDDAFSGLAGVCAKGGICTCNSGFVINPATGRCRAGATPDAATVTTDASVGKDTGRDTVDAPVGKDTGKDSPGVCTPGMDQSCNDDPIAAYISGTCQSSGTCACKSGYVINPSSGRCALAPKDAGPDLIPALDARTDSKTVCTPGMNQTCNDDPMTSATWGVCQANGTCSCNSGFVINTSTGKCIRPATSTCTDSYVACGCGCCGGTTPSPVCYYPSAGDSLSAIKAADETTKNSSTCATAGCSLGQRYLCCAEAAAEPAGSAQYSATLNVGALDRVSLKKTGSDGICVSLGLANPSSLAWKPLRVDLPTEWAIETLSAGACSSSSREQAIGAQGTVTFSPSGTSCAINAHLTVFFYVESGNPEPVVLSTRRIDADDIPISGGLPASYCK